MKIAVVTGEHGFQEKEFFVNSVSAPIFPLVVYTPALLRQGINTA